MSKQAEVDEAARWLLRMQDPSATTETFLEWQRWVAAKRANKIAFEEIETMQALLDRVTPKLSLPSETEMIADDYTGTISVSQFLAARAAGHVRNGPSYLPRRGESRWQMKARYVAAAAAAVAIFALCSLGFHVLHQSSRGEYAYSTAPGERRAFTLPDGSNVTLDADSALNVKLGGGHRLLRLARGEAYFKVARDPSRPFIVSAGAAHVRAIGTEFDVRMVDDRTVIAVVEGKVQVAAPSKDTAKISSSSITGRNADLPKPLLAQVIAGQAVAYTDDQGLDKLPPERAAQATAWMGGRRQYHNEPLKDVLADVDRYIGRRIEVADEATGALEFTGTLDVDNSDAWLKALSIALPVVVIQKANGVLLVSSDAKQLPSASAKPGK